MTEDETYEPPSGVLVYYVDQIIELYLRFFDLVCSGSFVYSHPDFPTIHASLNDELKKAIKPFEAVLKRPADSTLPYEQFDLDTVRETWPDERGELRKAQLRIKSVYPMQFEKPMPQEFILFLLQMGKMLDVVELSKLRHDVEQFTLYFGEEKRKRAEREQFRREFLHEADFDFLYDKEVKLNLLSFLEELRNTYFTESIRAPIILSGAMIEALLKEALKLKKKEVLHEVKKNQDKMPGDIDRWTFSDLIDISLMMEILPKDLTTQMDAVRNFRNFVHVHRAIESGIQLDKNYKEICKNTFLIVVKHVRDWFDKYPTTGDS